MSDFGNYKLVKTKKPHRCVTCNRIIPVGNKMYNYNGMYEGDWQNWYMCQPCETLDVSDGNDYLDGDDFSEWLREYFKQSECPKCHGVDEYGYHDNYHSDWDWSEDLKTVEFTCEVCGNKWSYYIGFGEE